MERFAGRMLFAALVVVGLGSLAHAGNPEQSLSSRSTQAPRVDAASLSTHEIGAWTFVPFLDPASREVRGYLAYYTGHDSRGDNLTLTWFERDPGGTNWAQSAWSSGDLASAVRYGESRVPGATAHRGDPTIALALSVTPDQGLLVPERVTFGMFERDPIAQALAESEDSGAILDVLRTSGFAVTPELPAAFALADARARGDAKGEQRIKAFAFGQDLDPSGQNTPSVPSAAPSTGGGVTPGDVVEICEIEPVGANIMLAGATPKSAERGKNTLLNQLAAADASLILGDGPMIYGMFCGCTTVYGTCTGTGAWTFDGALPTIGGWNCSFSRGGTKTWTKTGLTFWCCNTCTGSGTTSCTESCGCTVTALPCTPAGCGC